MPNIESRGISPDESVREIEDSISHNRENKYDFQVGLKDLDFDIDSEKVVCLGLAIPFASIDEAEQALTEGVITPITFIEFDNTEHKVSVFDYKPVGFSGFLDCVTHSLAITDLGLFEVGRYPAISLSQSGRYWQWFLHRHLAKPEELRLWQEENSLNSKELIERVYLALTGVEG
jgi:hypothetical protein